jgi:alpha-1,2-mannosyltransferase
LTEAHIPSRSRRSFGGHLPAIGLGLGLILFVFAWSGEFLGWRPPGIDFRTFYSASVTGARGGDIYDVEEIGRVASDLGIRDGVFPYLYSPFLALAMRPLGWLAPPEAQRIWSIAGLLIFGFAAALQTHDAAALARSGWSGPKRLAVFTALAAVLACALPLRNNIAMGQVNLFVVGLLALFMHCDRRGHQAVGGIALAVAALIKLTPLLLFGYLAARRRLRALSAAAGALAVLLSATLLFGALPSWKRFLAELPAMAHGRTILGLFPPSASPNFSIAGLLARAFGSHPKVVELGAPALSFLLVGVACVLAWRASGRLSEALALSTFLPAMIVISPLAYLHHVIYTFPAAMVLGAHLLSEERSVRRDLLLVFAAACVALAGIDFPLLYDGMHLGDLGKRFLTSINLYALLGLYAALLVAAASAVTARR